MTHRPGDIDLYKFREDLSQEVMNSFNSTNYKTFLQILNDHVPLRTLHNIIYYGAIAMGDKRDTRSYGHQGLCHSDDSELPSADDWEAYKKLCYRVSILLRASKESTYLAHFC